jgi:PTS system nitrogen regulatory IIA component
MNKIAELLPAANIVVDAEAATKPQLFALAGRLFETSANIPHEVVAAGLTAREKLGSTGLGQGIAIPHGRMRGLKEARAAFIRLKESIAFDAPDGKPVGQVFVLLVPEQATDQHLQLLSELAQMFSERTFREQLAQARDAAGIAALIGRWQPSPD